MRRTVAWASASVLIGAAAVAAPALLRTAPAARATTVVNLVGTDAGFSPGGSTTTVRARVPGSARAGDVLVVSVTAERGAIPTLSGVSSLTEVRADVDGTNLAVRTGYAFLTPADVGSAITASVPTARRMALAVAVWRGVGSVEAVSTGAVKAADRTEQTPSITPAHDGSLLVGLIGHSSNAAPWTTSFRPGSGWKERVEVTATHPAAANPSTYLVDRLVPDGGAGIEQSGTTAAVSLPGQRYFGTTLVLAPLTERERRENVLVSGVDRPDDTNTGVLPDTPLAPVTGDVRLSTPGQVFENKDVHGRITVTAADVTIRNVWVRGAVGHAPPGDQFLITATAATVRNLVVDHVTLRPDVPHWNWGSGIAGHDYTLRFADISGTVDGANVYNATATKPYRSNVAIRQSYVHDLVWWSAASSGLVHPTDTETHNDCVQLQGGWGTAMVGNALHAGPYAKQAGHWRTTGGTEPYRTVRLHSLPDSGPHRAIPDRGSGTEATGRYNWDDQANLMLNDNVGTTRQVTFTDNWLYGGAISVNGGGLHPAAGEVVGSFLRNRFDRSQGQQGSGGNTTHTITVAALTPSTVTTGTGTTDANRYLDGPEVTVRILAPN